MEKIKILYLEDSAYDAEVAKRVLEQAGIDFSMKLVDLEEEYKVALREYKPDVVLSDHSLYQFNSSRALEIFKKANLKVPFILVTGAVSEEFAVSILKEGADDYLLKSNIKRLPTSIEQAIQHRKLQKEKEIAQQKVAEQNTFLTQILASQPIAFYKTKLHDDHAVTYITESIERLTGFKPADFIENPSLSKERIHPDDKAKVLVGMAILNEEGSCEMSYRWKVADGSYKWFFDTNSIVKDEKNHKKHIAGALIDFTQKKLTEDKNKDLIDSITYARTIQETILPAKEKIKKDFPQSFILYKPKDIVSGDFYWFSNFNGHIIIGVCDCEGHGVPGAMMSMLSYSMLSEIIYSKQLFHPADILKRLNIQMKMSGLSKQKKNQEYAMNSMDMALCLIDKANKKIEFAGANRPLYFFRKVGLEIIKGEKHGIGGGAQASGKDFTNYEMSYEEGESIYMFSDGITDQFGGERNRKLMKKNLTSKLVALQSLDMAEQEIVIRRFLDKWQGNLEQTDDNLLIGITL